MSPVRAIVFDLYGTLFDVHSVAGRCEARWPGRGQEISALWRQKQLEYTWLRSLMGRYVDFEQATADALIYTGRRLELGLDDATAFELRSAYLRLAPFPDVPEALRRLNAHGLPLAILSNGSPNSIGEVVRHSGLARHFAELVSADAAKTFKPHGSVYALAETALSLPASAILFVSSNSWDISGAGYHGYSTCWVERSGTFEELGIPPDHVVGSIEAVADLLGAPR